MENWHKIACFSCSFNFDLIQIYYMRSIALSKSLTFSFPLTKYFVVGETQISISGRLAENKKRHIVVITTQILVFQVFVMYFRTCVVLQSAATITTKGKSKHLFKTLVV